MRRVDPRFLLAASPGGEGAKLGDHAVANNAGRVQPLGEFDKLLGRGFHLRAQPPPHSGRSQVQVVKSQAESQRRNFCIMAIRSNTGDLPTL